MSRTAVTLLALVATALAASAGQAAFIVNNPSFESPVLNDGAFVFSVSDYAAFNGITANPFPAQIQPQDGSNLLFIAFGGGFLFQDLFPDAPGTYTLTAGFAIEGPTTTGDFEYFFENIAPGNVNMGRVGTQQAFDETVLNSVTFTDRSISVDIPAGDPMLSTNLLRVVIGVANNTGQAMAIDNIRWTFTPAVPEPSTLAMGAVGAMATVARRRRS